MSAAQLLVSLIPLYLAMAVGMGLWLRHARRSGELPPSTKRAGAEARTVSVPLSDPVPLSSNQLDRLIALEAEQRGLLRRLTELEEASDKRYRSLMGAIHGAKGGRPRSQDTEEEQVQAEQGAWDKLLEMGAPAVLAPPPPDPVRSNGSTPRLIKRAR